jgi:hypothetical protein
LRSGLGGLQLGQGIQQAIASNEGRQLAATQQQAAAQQQQQSNALATQALGLGEDDSPESKRNALAGLASIDPQRAQSLLGFQANVASSLQASDDSARRSMITGALEARLSNNPLQVLRNRRQSLADQGLSTAETDSVISQFESGDQQGALDALDSAISFGQSTGVIKQLKAEESTDIVRNLEAAGIQRGTPEFKDAILQSVLKTPSEAELGIKQEGLDIRREEQKQRSLDRDLARETNELKRDELREKIARSKEKLGAAKSEKSRSVDQLIGTATELLNHPGLESASGPISSKLPTVLGDTADFEALQKSFTSSAVIPILDAMSGPKTDKDIEILKESLGAFSLEQTPETLKKRFRTFIEGLERVKAKAADDTLDKDAPTESTGDFQQIGRFKARMLQK